MNSTDNNVTIEWAPFEVAGHVSDKQLEKAAVELEVNFLKKQDGYLRRELLKGEGKQWVDLVYWSSPQAAAKAAEDANSSEAFLEYFSLMVGLDDAEDGIAHYRQVKTWN
ncbi:MAG: hypothetical protein KJN89_08855 [Gammaproteobacteria bacterium]|nr:hypothetical protein [Gammaproteobacteria bacterium]NNJ50477.1 hypothetical protein [Gammaproteobacteria bacterium]